MKTYPKIETLFVRDEKTFKVIPDEIRCPEFENIKNWLITEKIDGTCIRVLYDAEPFEAEMVGKTIPFLEFRGRTDKAQMPPFLLKKLQEMFPIDRMKEQFKDSKEVCLYGEGYGARIQKGGGNYREGASFRLCDVWIDDWWLRWEDVVEIAKALNIRSVPVFAPHTLREAIYLIRPNSDGSGLKSVVAVEDGGNPETQAEGIVVRAYPMVLFRNGNPIMWKLKKKDFAKEIKNE